MPEGANEILHWTKVQTPKETTTFLIDFPFLNSRKFDKMDNTMQVAAFQDRSSTKQTNKH
jgi:hypothetical protein